MEKDRLKLMLAGLSIAGLISGAGIASAAQSRMSGCGGCAGGMNNGAAEEQVQEQPAEQPAIQQPEEQGEAVHEDANVQDQQGETAQPEEQGTEGQQQDQ